MSGTVSGGKKVVQTRVQKYMNQGYSETEARKMVSDDYRRIGAQGGKNGNKKLNPDYSGGFAGDNELAKRAGAIGGSRSMRGHKLVKIEGDTLTYKRLSDNEYIEVKERYV